MAAYLPVIKAILPYLAPLVSAASPMFTRSSSDNGKDQPSTAQLINELQDAVNNNANSLKVIATQLQTSIEAFDEREALDQKKLAEVHSLIESNAAERNSLKIAIDAAIRDIQTTKLISLAALGSALVAIAIVILR
jgi:uncharacterized protein YqgV (UPF0045/DUF77 family)